MMRRLLACVILGMMAGGLIVFFWIGKDLDRLYLEVSSLKMQCNELIEENFRLSSQIKKPPVTPTVRTIFVEAQAPDAVLEIRAIQFVKKQLSHLVGESLDDFKDNPRYIPLLLEGDTMTVDKKTYRFHVVTVVISEIVYIQVRISPYVQTGARTHVIQ